MKSEDFFLHFILVSLFSSCEREIVWRVSFKSSVFTKKLFVQSMIVFDVLFCFHQKSFLNCTLKRNNFSRTKMSLVFSIASRLVATSQCVKSQIGIIIPYKLKTLNLIIWLFSPTHFALRCFSSIKRRLKLYLGLNIN